MRSPFLSFNSCSLTCFLSCSPACLTQGIGWHTIKMPPRNLELRQTNLVRYHKSTPSNLGYQCRSVYGRIESKPIKGGAACVLLFLLPLGQGCRGGGGSRVWVQRLGSQAARPRPPWGTDVFVSAALQS